METGNKCSPDKLASIEDELKKIRAKAKKLKAKRSEDAVTLESALAQIVALKKKAYES